MLKSGVQGLGDHTQHKGEEHRQEQTDPRCFWTAGQSQNCKTLGLALWEVMWQRCKVEWMTLVATVLIPSPPGWFSGCTAH